MLSNCCCLGGCHNAVDDLRFCSEASCTGCWLHLISLHLRLLLDSHHAHRGLLQSLHVLHLGHPFCDGRCSCAPLLHYRRCRLRRHRPRRGRPHRFRYLNQNLSCLNLATGCLLFCLREVDEPLASLYYNLVFFRGYESSRSRIEVIRNWLKSQVSYPAENNEHKVSLSFQNMRQLGLMYALMSFSINTMRESRASFEFVNIRNHFLASLSRMLGFMVWSHTLDASIVILVGIGAAGEAVIVASVLDVKEYQINELVVVASHVQVVNAHVLQIVVVSSHIEIVHMRYEALGLSWLRLLRLVVYLVVVTHEIKAHDLILNENLVVVAIDLEGLLSASDALVLVVSVDGA